MAGIAGSAQEYIAIDISMVTSQFALIVVLVTVYAAEQAVVAWGGMAVRTSIPFTAVVAAVDWKKLLIVVNKSGWTPARGCGVAECTVSRKSRCLMIRVLRCLVVCQVTGNANWGGVAVVAGLVTPPTVHNVMALGERKKIVRYIFGRPVKCIRSVAVSTLYGVARSYVIGIGRGNKVGIVTVNASIADPVKFKAGFGNMAGIAVGGCMRTQQRETIIEVQLHDIINQPAIGSVAAAAVIAYCHSMHIGMTGDTVCTGFRKNEGGMACATVNSTVLSIQLKACGFMTKPTFLSGHISCLPKGKGYVPACCLMAGNTVLLQLVAMGVLRRNQYGCEQNK